MNAIRMIKQPKESYFRKKLYEAKQLGDDWDGRDITYFHLNKHLEQEKQKKQDEKEIEKAEEQKNNMKNK